MINKKRIEYWGVFVGLMLLVVIIVFLPFSDVFQKYSFQTPFKEDLHLKVENNVVFLDGREVYRFVPVDGGVGQLGGIIPLHIQDSTGVTEGSAFIYSRKYINGFLIGETPVTMELWQYVMFGEEPHNPEGEHAYPSKITPEDWGQFIKKLSRITGRTFRLPTMDEWEYAARGGTHSMHFKYAGSDDIEEVAIYKGNYMRMDMDFFPIGKTKKPNELGLYDMSGGVAELTSTHMYETNANSRTIYNGMLEQQKKGIPFSEEDISYIEFMEGYAIKGGSYFNEAEQCELDHMPIRYSHSGARIILEH